MLVIAWANYLLTYFVLTEWNTRFHHDNVFWDKYAKVTQFSDKISNHIHSARGFFQWIRLKNRFGESLLLGESLFNFLKNSDNPRQNIVRQVCQFPFFLFQCSEYAFWNKYKKERKKEILLRNTKEIRRLLDLEIDHEILIKTGTSFLFFL